MEGPAAQGWEASQSSAGAPHAPCEQMAETAGEHIALLQYDGPRLVGEMKGAEAA